MTAKTRVLVLDDQAKARELMRDILELNGFAVLMAATRSEAENQLDAAPDVVISDIQLSGIDQRGGLNFAQAVHDRLPEVPVILVTGHASLDSAVDAVRSRVFDYLTKPVDHLQLRSVIDQALKWRALALERRALVEEMQRLKRRMGEETGQLEDQIAQQEHMASLGYLASGIVHDLGSPLNICLLEVQAQRNRGDDPALAHLESALSYMNDLLGSLADFARSKPHVAIATDDMCDIVRRTIRLIAPEAKRGRVRLMAQIDETIETEVPSVGVQEMLVNLIGNAVQVSPPQGQVVVGLARRESRVDLSVRDQGPGIPPQEEARLFEPFITRDVGQEGKRSGLGLFMVRRIAERLDVEIRIERPAAGGTCFHLLFPTTVR